MKEVPVLLSGGQRVGVVIYGDETLREPILYFHGFPGSSLEASLADKFSSARGISLIGVERPGYNGSTPIKGMSLEEWARLVGTALDQLGIAKAGIIALSGGCPHAMACARYIPNRLTKVVIVSGISEALDANLLNGMIGPNRSLILLGQKIPWLGQSMVSLMAFWWWLRPHDMIRWFRLFLKNGDIDILSRKSVAGLLEDNLRRAFKHGIKGVRDDFKRIISPWGFSLGEIRTPVIIWHGQKDKYVPFAMAEYMARLIPGATLRTVPTGGHFMIVEVIDQVLAEF